MVENSIPYSEHTVAVTLSTLKNGKEVKHIIQLLKDGVDRSESNIGSLLHSQVANTLKEMLKK